MILSFFAAAPANMRFYLAVFTLRVFLIAPLLGDGLTMLAAVWV